MVINWMKYSTWWEFTHIYQTDWQKNPDSKVHGAYMGPTLADRTQVGPMLAQWTLLSGEYANLAPDSIEALKANWW